MARRAGREARDHPAGGPAGPLAAARRTAPPAVHSPRAADLACILSLLLATLAVYAPALFAGRVLLPADIVQIMPPWAAHARDRYPDFRFAQNQLHGPIFEYYSWRHYARERIRAGEVPLWNPGELSGNVLLANSQSAVLYPPNILLYLFSLPMGINLVTALHTFLTGLLMFGLLRTLGLRPSAALTGALAWMFGGLMTVWTEFQTPTATLCWLPGALWAWERYAQGRGWRWAVLGGGSTVALALLAGHLQFAFYVVAAFVVFAVVRTIQARRRAASLGVLAAAVAFGVLVSMATTLPVLEMGRMNFRAARPDYGASVALRMPPAQLLMLAQPNMLGNPRDYILNMPDGTTVDGYSYFGAFEYIEYTAYVGIPALMLALVGAAMLVRGRLRKRADGELPPAFWAVLILGLLGLLLALGTPLCALFVYGVPGYRQFNATGRALCLVAFALAALAGLGVEALCRSRERRDGRPVVGVLLGAAGLVLLALLVSYPVSLNLAAKSRVVVGSLAPFPDLYAKWGPYEVAGLSTGLLFGVAAIGLALVAVGPGRAARGVGVLGRAPGIAVWLLPALALADLLLWARGFNPMPPSGMLGDPTDATTFLGTTPPDRVVSVEAPGQAIKSLIAPNYNLVVGYREAQGADSLHTRRYHLLAEGVLARLHPPASLSDPNTLHFPGLAHPVFDMLNVRYATTMPSRPAPGPAYKPVVDAEVRIWENAGRLGRLWVVGRATPVTASEALSRVLAPGFDARHEAVVESGAPALDPSAGGSQATLVAFSPHRLAADVDSHGRGLVVFSEMAFPGWRAAVDGRPAPLLTADYVLRAVPVPPGRHRVALIYDPSSYRLGLYLSVLALAAGAALLGARAAVRPTGTSLA